MTESENMKQLIIERVKSCVELINLKHPSFTMNVPNISFDLEGKILGQAKYSNWTLSFNLKFAPALGLNRSERVVGVRQSNLAQ